MPMHDWTRVEAGIFHAFHHNWITAISGALNGGLLPPEYYALPEQLAAGFGPDILALQTSDDASTDTPSTGVLTRPKTRFMAEAAGEFYRRKKSSVVVRHISGDRMVAVVEIVSPGNTSGRHGLGARVHLLIVDPETVAVGDRLPEMPLFIEPDRHVPVPLEPTYATAFEGMPLRWREVLSAPD